jgi:hypothetical protein
MRAIIIDDKDAKQLLESLQLAKLKARNNPRDMQAYKPEDVPWAIDDVHQWFHYHVCKWLQDQGCDVVRR